MDKKEEMVLSTFRLPKEMHNLLYNEVKWAEKRAINPIIIEALELWLTKHGYR